MRKLGIGIAVAGGLAFAVLLSCARDVPAKQVKPVSILDGVVIAGYFLNHNSAAVPCLWKNGERENLPVPSAAIDCEPIYGMRSEGKTLVVGFYKNSDDTFLPCYWLDGILNLPDFNARGTIGIPILHMGESGGFSIGSIVKDEGSGKLAVRMMENGQEELISFGHDIESAELGSLGFRNGKRYAVGNCYRKNGSATPFFLIASTIVYPDLTAENGNAYAAGFNDNAMVGYSQDGKGMKTPMLWNDGKIMELPRELVGINGIFSGISRRGEGKNMLSGVVENDLSLGVPFVHDGTKRIDLEGASEVQPDGSYGTVPYDIVSIGDSLIAIGCKYDSVNERLLPCYWENERIHELPVPEGTIVGSTRSICIVN